MLFRDKVALVTGGASGIGRATALAFAREGARVVVADIAEAGGRETVKAIGEQGGEALFQRADMLKPADIREMVAATVARFGRLDCAFNNAGHRGGSTNVVDCTEQEWDMVLGLNLKAIWLCMKYQIPEMLKVGGGAIVNTSSGLGNFAAPLTASYSTSKHAVIGLTRSAAVDFGPKNIRINALLPGATDTPMLAPAAQGSNLKLQDMANRIPLRRLGTAEDQAEAVIWLCSERAAFTHGLSLICDGGLSVLR
ncbi:glucose 1-dehydrogenase [Peristeroidobacter soli]|jgi:NAD(P)-dependent dehydrogenase (short-subunit alcohol dehydrogenase family)|uniref:glucose 1-dehydrogenase n=1 Tax=Peristeroidobacter soli TaxID=2497877 RepID=UPI00101D666E|nr:glucose 1-dehydrogenase [Peristeroidobacter soli]